MVASESILTLTLLLIFGNIISVFTPRHLFFDGDRYSVLGAEIKKYGVGEKVGEVERTSLRTF